MAHVFISYSRKDTAFVDRIERSLRAEGILTWRDVHSIPGGSQWFRRIKQGLESSYAMLYIDTLNAELSEWVEREFLFAAALRLPIIPVKEDARYMSLATINLNPVICDEASFEIGIGKIVALLAAMPQTAIVDGAVAPAPVAAGDADTEPVGPAIDFRQEILDYVEWLLVKSQADLRDALYVNLEAQTEKRPAMTLADSDNDMAIGLDMDPDMGFARLPLEQIRGEAFDKDGDPVPDARVPVKETRRVVLLGDPGSGKTTTLLQLAVDLARALQDDGGALIPVFVPLRKYDGATSFEAFVRSQMYNLQDSYTELLAHHEVIFLLDALNEMPRSAEDGRALVPDVQAFARDQARWVISCRVRDYQEELQGIDDTSKVRLQPLDPPRIRDVIRRRFAEQYAPAGIASAKDGEALWRNIYGSDDLLKAWDLFVATNRRGQFWDIVFPSASLRYLSPEGEAWCAMRDDKRRMMHLCRNPYMTRMVCDIYAIDNSLPENRGALFRKFVDKLLERDRKAAQAVGARWLYDALIRAGLAQIAYAMGTETEMDRAEAERILNEHLEGVDHALLLRLAQGASLLDVGQSVRFTHQLLQEYFASEVLGADLDRGADPATIWPSDGWWQPTGREETLIILAGVRGDPETVARWVAPAQPELAIEVIRESGVELALADINPETRKVLIQSARNKSTEVNPIGRAAAYRVLGIFDADDRPGVGLRADSLPDIMWSETIPPGEYPIGGDEKAYDSLPAQNCQLSYSYQISRYPVTYRQFQIFLDAPDGYDGEHHDWFEGLALHESERRMRDQIFKYWNHPRDNVNWYQGVAFTRWLSWNWTGTFHSLDTIAEWPVRLPTELEWEIAARGPEGLYYPYGPEFDAMKDNTGETGIGQTSAVGMFGGGASWCGSLDMSGNVLEWCLNPYEDITGVLVNNSMRSVSTAGLRGGFWSGSQLDARAASRGDDNPNHRIPYIGFRVVVLSHLSVNS